MMATVIKRVSRKRNNPSFRVMIEGRIALLYPEGTLIRDRHGRVWRSWRDHEFDTYPLWEFESGGIS